MTPRERKYHKLQKAVRRYKADMRLAMSLRLLNYASGILVLGDIAAEAAVSAARFKEAYNNLKKVRL